MKQKLAIDIGNRNIKLLVGNNKKIFHNAAIETPPDAMEDNKIVDIEKIYKAINDHILRNNIKAKSVCFSIHGQDVVVRHIEVPIMEKKSLGNTVEWEINQYLPENGTNHYLDFEIVEKENTPDKKVYKLLTVAAPKEKVDSYVELAGKLELKIEAIDIAANCVARVFANSAKNGKEFRSIGIIDIGTRSSSIVVMDKGKLFMEREVPFGIENLTREISRRLQTEMDEALKYLLNNFSFDRMDEEHEVDKRIQELFDNVSSTFLKVIQFYTTGKVQKNLDEIFVIGGGSQIKGIGNYLSRYLGSPVYTVDTPEKISRKIHLPQNDMLKFNINTLGLLLRKE